MTFKNWALLKQAITHIMYRDNFLIAEVHGGWRARSSGVHSLVRYFIGFGFRCGLVGECPRQRCRGCSFGRDASINGVLILGIGSSVHRQILKTCKQFAFEWAIEEKLYNCHHYTVHTWGKIFIGWFPGPPSRCAKICPASQSLFPSSSSIRE